MESTRIDDLARRLAASLPAAVGSLRHDIELNFRQVLQGVFGRLDLATRADFDTQARVLERAQRQVAALETRVAALEAALGATAPGAAPAGKAAPGGEAAASTAPASHGSREGI